MIETFIIILAFQDWDDCWNYVHEHDLQDDMVVCAKAPVDVSTDLAPTKSVRPKARDDQ